MAADNASTNIQREAPFLEDYRRRLMDSVFAATKDKAIVPGRKRLQDMILFKQQALVKQQVN